jgi:hypothetical protein
MEPDNFCEFELSDNGHVTCLHCGRGFSGTVEEYNGRIVCAERGPGADFEKTIETISTFLRIKVIATKCNRCKKLKLLMNENGKDWCRNNKRLITALAHYNSRELGHNIPGAAINLALRYSLMRPKAGHDHDDPLTI